MCVPEKQSKISKINFCKLLLAAVIINSATYALLICRNLHSFFPKNVVSIVVYVSLIGALLLFGLFATFRLSNVLLRLFRNLVMVDVLFLLFYLAITFELLPDLSNSTRQQVLFDASLCNIAANFFAIAQILAALFLVCKMLFVDDKCYFVCLKDFSEEASTPSETSLVQSNPSASLAEYSISLEHLPFQMQCLPSASSQATNTCISLPNLATHFNSNLETISVSKSLNVGPNSSFRGDSNSALKRLNCGSVHIILNRSTTDSIGSNNNDENSSEHLEQCDSGSSGIVYVAASGNDRRVRRADRDNADSGVA